MFKQIHLSFIIVLLLFCFPVSSSGEENLVENASNSSQPLPELMKYPLYFRERDVLTLENIKAEIRHRVRFVTSKRPEAAPYASCHKFQKGIAKSIDRSAKNGELTFTTVDNQLLFGKDKEKIGKIQSPVPRLLSPSCNYHSYGDISKGCVIYCDYHGMDFESDFYKANQKELEASRPFITAGDIAEIVIFLPMLVFPLALILFLKTKKGLLK